jgi:hypothetical protein
MARRLLQAMQRKIAWRWDKRPGGAHGPHGGSAGEPAPRMRVVNIALAAVATCSIVLGSWARFKGLGSAPLAVDEFFIVRSVENLLQHGLPQFTCGGLYTRGLLLQYCTALLALLGVALPTAARVISGVCSLLALPAAFMVGRRVGGITNALLAIVVLALSIWEIEMARFGRMYAPFQAVFLWYLVYFLKWAVDGDPRAGRPMAILTIIGAALWEGAIFLAIANFIPLMLQRRSLKLTRTDWLTAFSYLLLLAAVYWVVTIDFRSIDTVPSLPADYGPGSADSVPDRFPTTPSLWGTLLGNRMWLVLFTTLSIACIAALRLVWRSALPRSAAITLTAAFAAALAHQFIAAGAVLLVPALFRFCSWSQLTSKKAWPAYAAILLCGVFWVNFAYLSRPPPTSASFAKNILSFLLPLVSAPDVVEQLLIPWAPAIPALGAGLVLLLSLATIEVLAADEPGVSAQRALLTLVVCLLLVMCAIHTPRHETRYVFFLYPAAVILAISGMAALVRRIAALTAATSAAVTAASVLAAFVLSEDFHLQHLLEIDQPKTIFRAGQTPAQQSHLVVRDDTRLVAAWLRSNAMGKGTVVVSTLQSLDYYAPEVAYFFVARGDFNFESYACQRGTIERWSNRPLLSSVQDLEAIINQNAQTYLVTYADRLGALLPHLSRYHPTVELSSGHLVVVRFFTAAQNGSVT